MKEALSKVRRFLREDRLCTPRGMLLRAGLLAAAFGVCHAAGLREYTTVLSGSVAGAGSPPALHVILGGTYVVTYLGFVVAVPILFAGAALMALAIRLLGAHEEQPT